MLLRFTLLHAAVTPFSLLSNIPTAIEFHLPQTLPVLAAIFLEDMLSTCFLYKHVDVFLQNTDHNLPPFKKFVHCCFSRL
jgi:hypothetical protein